jgi:hypothetical protein
MRIGKVATRTRRIAGPKAEDEASAAARAPVKKKRAKKPR